MTEQTQTRALPFLDGKQYSFISCGKTSFDLKRVNARNVRCGELTCKRQILPGLGISRIGYKANGYLCLKCFGATVKVATVKMGYPGNQSGFRFNFAGNLDTCEVSRPDYSPEQVIESVHNVLLETAYTHIDHLIGDETASPVRVGDVAAALIGA